MANPLDKKIIGLYEPTQKEIVDLVVTGKVKPHNFKSNKMAKKQKEKVKVRTMSLKSKNMEIMFSMINELVHIVVRQPGQQNKKVIISPFDWMQINKGLFNPDEEKAEIKEPKKSFSERLADTARERLSGKTDTKKSDA